MWSRRAVLAAISATALAPERAEARPPAAAGPDPALEEAFWREIQEAFTLDRTLINLNNGGVSPSPRVVHEAYKRYLDVANQAPAYHLWQLEEPGIEAVRRDLAAAAGCDPEELAITRNASESLQIAQLGFELAPGDEVLTTEHDYPRMLATWEQRVRRDGIVLKKIPFPVPPSSQAAIVDAFRSAIGPKTKIVHLCHITNLSGHILPVREVCELARAAGARSIVDGAHAFAHFPFRIAELGCDVYGTSLHKWLFAPIGTGFLYVRKDRIPEIWPLQAAAPEAAADIRKFEEIGTHPAAGHNAIAEALQFHRRIGPERKIARLRWLKKRWIDGLGGFPGVSVLAHPDPALGGAIGTFSIEGVEPGALTSWLWTKHRIVATPIAAVTQAGRPPSFSGVRVTPSVYTTPEEIDRFVDAMAGWIGGRR